MSKNKTPKSGARENKAAKNSWSENSEPINSEPDNTAVLDSKPYNFERGAHEAEEALWAPLSPAERRQWSQGLLDFRPTLLGSVTTNLMLESMMQRTGVLTLKSWVQPILAFERAGFSAQDWLEIMTSLHVLLARQPDLLLDNPAVTMLGDHHLTSRVAIQSGSWLAWLPVRRSGKSALAATRAVLLKAKPATAQTTHTRNSGLGGA